MGAVSSQATSAQSKSDNPGRKRKAKKVYDHELSENEKFAVAILLQGRKAINVLIDNLRSGRSTSSTALRAAMAIASEAAASFVSDKPTGGEV